MTRRRQTLSINYFFSDKGIASPFAKAPACHIAVPFTRILQPTSQSQGVFRGIPNSCSFRTRLKIQRQLAHGPDLGAQGRLKGKKEGPLLQEERQWEAGPCADRGVKACPSFPLSPDKPHHRVLSVNPRVYIRNLLHVFFFLLDWDPDNSIHVHTVCHGESIVVSIPYP